MGWPTVFQSDLLSASKLGFQWAYMLASDSEWMKECGWVSDWASLSVSETEYLLGCCLGYLWESKSEALLESQLEC